MSVSWGHEVGRGSGILDYCSPSRSSVLVMVDKEPDAQPQLSQPRCLLLGLFCLCLYVGKLGLSPLGSSLPS